MRVTFTVNGRQQEADDVWEGESLLYVLRERLGFPGSKNACEQGECGSCTVRLDGEPVCACLVAAGQVQGREVVTVEGLADLARQRKGCAGSGCGNAAGGDSGEGGTAQLSPVQQAFIDAGAVQCGFCTPGLLVAADELIERNARPSDADIREALSGNLCRCTGYETILDAVRLAAARTDQAAAPAAAGEAGAAEGEAI
jgi:carbon-monoxide dehydrogenase small subunit